MAKCQNPRYDSCGYQMVPGHPGIPVLPHTGTRYSWYRVRVQYPVIPGTGIKLTRYAIPVRVQYQLPARYMMIDTRVAWYREYLGIRTGISGEGQKTGSGTHGNCRTVPTGSAGNYLTVPCRVQYRVMQTVPHRIPTCTVYPGTLVADCSWPPTLNTKSMQTPSIPARYNRKHNNG